jgi:hypothetical protein
MAKQNRTTLKNYFQTGDKPSQAQYADLIDSKVNLSESNTGDITLTGKLNLTGDITSSNISASGNIIANSGSFNYIESINKIRHTGDINTEIGFSSDTVQIKANNRETFRGGSNFTRVGNDDTVTQISGSSVKFNSPINTTSNSGTGSFAGGVVLTAPNGNQFRFTINNSGHLSLTGSAV